MFQCLGCRATAILQQSKQKMLRAQLGMIERLGLFLRQRDDLLYARRIGDMGNAMQYFFWRRTWHALFQFHTKILKIDAKFLENINSNPLVQFDESEQEMLGAKKTIITTVGLLACQCQCLTGAWCEV